MITSSLEHNTYPNASGSLLEAVPLHSTPSLLVGEKQTSCSVLMDPKEAQCQRFFPCVKSNALVRFGGVSEVWPSSDNDRDVNLKERWYSQEDFHHFKSELIADVKQFVKTSRKSKRRIVKAYRKMTESREIIKHNTTLQETQDTTIRITEVGVWFHGCIDAVGLEKLVHPDIYHEKRQRRNMLFQAVDEVQHESTKYMLSCEMHSAMLRLVCESLTNPSTKFAQYIAQAAADVPTSTSSSSSPII